MSHPQCQTVIDMQTNFVFIVFFLLSCNTNRIPTRKILFKDSFDYYEKRISQKYSIEFPKEGILKKSRYDFTGEGKLEYRILFPDSSVFFINNNFENISRLNRVNMFETGVKSLNRTQVFDTLLYKGTQKNGRFWKEHYLGDLVIGYSNVKDSLVAEKFCSSLKKQ
jgi:hypothetical protein